MAEAKARTLKIRPIQSTDLAFNMPGVIEHHNQTLASLGSTVNGFSLTTLYGQLDQSDSNGRLKFDAAEIRKFLEQQQGVSLFSLRAESLAAAIERAICQRQNAFLRTYKHQTTIIDEFEELFPPPGDPRIPDSKLGRIERLRNRADERHKDLDDAYQADGRTGVVRTASTETQGSSVSTSHSEGRGDTESDSGSDTKGKVDTKAEGTENSTSEQSNAGFSEVNSLPMAFISRGHHTVKIPDPATSESTVPQVSRHYNQEKPKAKGEEDLGKYKLSQRVEIQESLSAPMQWNGTDDWVEVQTNLPNHVIQKITSDGTAATTTSGGSNSDSQSTSESTTSATSKSKSTSETDGTGQSTMQQDAVHHPMEYRHPDGENDIRWHRRHLDLQNERLPQALFANRVPHLSTLMDNELRVLDLEIKQLQLNFIHTFLVSPLSGVITGIFKDIGESVQPGEATMRVENDEQVYIVGRVNFRGRMELGAVVKITTSNAFESGRTVTIEGVVASIRGHDSDNDEWDVICRCDNRDAANPSKRKFPLNYSFDYKDVSVDIG